MVWEQIWHNFHFLRPWILLLLLIPAAFYFYVFRGVVNLSSWEKICDKNLMEYLLIKGGNFRRRLSMFLIYAGLISAVLAAAGPAWQKNAAPQLMPENAVMVLLNLSTDMADNDVSPNRLSRAKIEITSLLEKLPDAQTGLIVYTAEPFLVSPLSDDPDLIISLLPAINFDIMPSNGDRLDRAIRLGAEKIFEAGFARGNLIVFSAEAGTDFEAAQTAASEALAQGIKVYTVSVRKSPAPELARIAAAGGGRAATRPETFNQIFETLSKEGNLKAWQESANQAEAWQDYGYYLLCLPLLCCLWFFRKGALFAFLAFFMAFPANAAFFVNDNVLASRYYKQEDYMRAAQTFKNQDWRAASLYKAGDYESAIKAYEGKNDPESLYNYGNALAKSGNISGAAEAYEKVLAQQPQHEDALYNLEYIKQQQKNQPQKSAKQEKQDKEQQSPSNADQQPNQGEQNQPPQADVSGQDQNSPQSLKPDQAPPQTESEATDEPNQSNEQSQKAQSEKNKAGQPQQERQKLPQMQSKEGTPEQKYDEQAQAREQQFRDVPEDRGGLLRAFIRREYLKGRYKD